MRRIYCYLFILGLQALLVLPGFAQQFLPQGNAVKLSKRCYRVTENLGDQQGAIWWDSKIDLTKPIELDFIFYMGDKDAGADGMAFIFQNDPRGLNAAGDAGGGLYFGDVGGGGIAIEPSVAIEFDTWRNDCNNSDPTFDHTTVVYDGDVCNPQFRPVQINPNNKDVEDNKCHNYKIKWNPATQELQMYFEGNLRFTHKDDLINKVFKGVTQVYYGFAGSTGGAINEQSVCVLQGNTVPVARDDQASVAMNTEVDTPVLANDTDEDKDDLYVTKIITPPLHGDATIQNAATIKYAPNPSYTGPDELVYQVCDVNADNCYSNCATATVRYQVGCPALSLETEKVKDNAKCDEALPNNGVARAYVLEGINKVTAGYTFRWYTGTDITVPPAYLGPVQSGLAEGNYRVVAINNLSMCPSTVGSVTIARVNPSISPDDVLLVQESAVTSCRAPGGSLSASVKNQTNGYSFTWYLDAADINDPTKIIGNGPRISGLQARSYTVLVKELATGCIGLNSIGVVNTTVQPVVQLVSLVTFTSCAAPNGSVSVNVGGSTTGYTFEWYNGTAVRTGPADFVGPVYSSLNPGSYTVRATNDATGCQSSPVTYVVPNATPSITVGILLRNASATCLTTNGKLEASVTTPNTQGYLYQWYTGQPPVDVSRRLVNETNLILDNLLPGIYTVEVTNRDNGCKTYSTYALTLPSQPIITVSQTTPFSSCSAPNGVLTATYTGPGTVTYEWYRGNSVSTQKLISGANTAVLSGLIPGEYTAVASNGQCQSIPVTATVSMSSPAVKPDVALSVVKGADCADKNGELKVVDATSGSLVTPGSATFAWYRGKEKEVATWIPVPNPSNPKTGLSGGDYTVVVTSTASGCTDTASVFLPPAVVFPLQVAVIAEPVTNCSNANGRVEAKVINGVGSYEFKWFQGQSQVGTGAVLVGLSAGSYRVEVSNADGLVCLNVAPPVVAVVADETREPVVTITEDAPMRNCDPSRGNGQLSVSLNENLSQYTFQWFQGTNPLVGATTPIATGLTAGTYSVLVTHVATGCQATKRLAVRTQPTPIPAPTPIIRNHMTSCLQPNGTVAASVRGNTSRYLFNWYKGDRVQGTPFFTGPEVTGLDIGVFSVTATDKETACVSEKTTFTILDGRKYPDFTFRVINSSCTDDTGLIEVVVTKAVNLDKISWSRGATSDNATNISQQPVGEYEVTLTTQEGCSTTKKVRIGVDVRAYNGVSANNDGLNDHFIIDCIETFPGNNVKILNRAGALVFEGNGYDNVQVKFEGTGNRGMYVTGNQLPAGTYFYIIDKKDGTQALSGFLELVR